MQKITGRKRLKNPRKLRVLRARKITAKLSLSDGVKIMFPTVPRQCVQRLGGREKRETNRRGRLKNPRKLRVLRTRNITAKLSLSDGLKILFLTVPVWSRGLVN